MDQVLEKPLLIAGTSVKLRSGRTLDLANLAIDARGLVRSFGKGTGRVTILKSVDLQIEHGEIALVMGPSGSGQVDPACGGVGSAQAR